MVPFVDVHCHLLAGLDDGPQTLDQAISMCELAGQDGVRLIAATAHINEDWPNVTPEKIRQSTARLTDALRDRDLPLDIVPSSEVMVVADIEDVWERGELLSIADQNKYLLIEQPHEVFVDLREIVINLVEMGLRPILAHPERVPQYLHTPGIIEDLVALGCVLQINADSIARPRRRDDERALRQWAKRGLVHLVASDGHSVDRRPPGISAAFNRLASWTTRQVAIRACSSNGFAVLRGFPLHLPQVMPLKKRTWMS
ncbi:MAG: hypothetical protein MPJ50_17280 [Pirellulales bacterium]|nr:hypothetical protein [Pirellulales bacterium]